MSNYKVGDVAALFSKPKQPTSESGKKLQSLFKEFHSKNRSAFQSKDASPKWTNKTKAKNEGSEDQGIIKKNKKRKFSATVDPESQSNEHNLKKFKETDRQLKNDEEVKNNSFLKERDFPRKKKKASKFNSSQSHSFIKPKTNDSSENEIKSTAISTTKNKPNANSGFIKKSTHKIYDDTDIFEKGHNENSKIKTDVDDSEDVSLREEIKDFIKGNSKKSKKKRGSNANSEDHPQEKLESSFNFKNGPKVINQVPDFIRKPKNKNKAINSSFSNDGGKKSNKKTFQSDNDTLFKSEDEDEDYVQGKKNKKEFHKINNLGKKSFKKPFVKREPDFAKLLDRNEDNADKLSRTLFVGNLSLDTRLNHLKKLFSPFGEIEYIRFKGIETNKAKIFNKNAPKSLNSNYAAESAPGFVVFQERESAVNALALSGTVFKDRHITVDFAMPVGSKKLYDSKRSIFIGNLPFDVTDENIWDAFSDCGKMEGVRVVRDKETGIGKGFGYVLFSTVESRKNALSLEDIEIEGRTVRIKAVDSNKETQRKSIGPTVFKADTFKSRAIKLKQKNKNPNSRKSITKLVKKEKMKRQKKKIASLLQKSMK